MVQRYKEEPPKCRFFSSLSLKSRNLIQVIQLFIDDSTGKLSEEKSVANKRGGTGQITHKCEEPRY